MVNCAFGLQTLHAEITNFAELKAFPCVPRVVPPHIVHKAAAHDLQDRNEDSGRSVISPARQRLKRELEIKKKNNLAQRNTRCVSAGRPCRLRALTVAPNLTTQLLSCSRERRKQRYESLERKVGLLHGAVTKQEKLKEELLAQIQNLQARHNLENPDQSKLLPQLPEVSPLSKPSVSDSPSHTICRS